MAKSFDDSQFLNVDLDIISKADLTPLAEFWGEKVCVLYNDVHPEDGHLLALEPNPQRKVAHTPERYLRLLVDLIKTLPPELQGLWNNASSRTFDIGFRGGIVRPGRRDKGGHVPLRPCRGDLNSALLLELGGLKATVRFTIYPYDPEPSESVDRS